MSLTLPERRSPRRLVVRTVAAVVAAGVLVAPATSAVADPATDGFWYFDAFNIQAAHDAGYTGKGITIAVIDSQLNPDVPTLQGADIEIRPSSCFEEDGTEIPVTSDDIEQTEHGTNVLSYLVGSGKGYPGQTGIKGIVPDATIIYSAVGRYEDDGYICETKNGDIVESGLSEGIDHAVKEGVDLISISLGGGTQLDAVLAIARAVNAGIPIVSGAINEQVNFGGGFPGTANGVITVQSIDSSVAVQGGHTNPATDVAGPGVQMIWQGAETFEQQRYATGTSLATPVVTGFLALVAQKYPGATGNQLIQTLIRNTNAEDHELSYDETGRYGYGVASATHMLTVDPAQYDDVNPLISDSPNAGPTVQEIADAHTLEEYLEKEGIDDGIEDPSDPDSAASTAFPVLWIALGLVGLVVVAGIVTLIVVVGVRRSSTDAARTGGE